MNLSITCCNETCSWRKPCPLHSVK